MSINKLNWEKLENIWLPIPFFLLNGKNSEFGPTNWCRFKLIPLETDLKTKKYNFLIAFDTRTTFENDGFEEEDEAGPQGRQKPRKEGCAQRLEHGVEGNKPVDQHRGSP